MELSEHELRAMIREAIARHTRAAGPDVARASGEPGSSLPGAHASHALFALVPAGDGECVIEPSVRCNHCGYCKSLGH